MNIVSNTDISTVPVAAESPPWERQEQVVLEGVHYDIRVAIIGGNYYGAWVCWNCGEHGAGVLEASPERASTKAKLRLCEHHNAVHRRRPRPKPR